MKKIVTESTLMVDGKNNNFCGYYRKQGYVYLT